MTPLQDLCMTLSLAVAGICITLIIWYIGRDRNEM